MLSELERSLLTAACLGLPRREALPVASDYILVVLGMTLDFQMCQPVINAAFAHFKGHHQLSTHNELKILINIHPDSKAGNLALAKTLWNYDLWTRAEYLLALLEKFEKRGIQTLESLSDWASKASFKDDVHRQFKTANHSMGYTMFQYLRLRLGHETIKLDSRVIKFVESIIQRKPSAQECVQGIETAARILVRSARELDAAIYSDNGA